MTKNNKQIAYLLHFTIRLTRMIDKSSITAHSVAVDHQTAFQMQTVMMSIVHINAVHPLFKLLIRHHFPNVLQDEFALFNWLLRPNSPT